MNKAKLEAAGKMAFGAGRVLSGLAMGTGHGLLGTWMRNHHQMRVAMLMGKRSVEAGARTFREGLDEWNDASA